MSLCFWDFFYVSPKRNSFLFNRLSFKLKYIQLFSYLFSCLSFGASIMNAEQLRKFSILVNLTSDVIIILDYR